MGASRGKPPLGSGSKPGMPSKSDPRMAGQLAEHEAAKRRAELELKKATMDRFRSPMNVGQPPTP